MLIDIFCLSTPAFKGIEKSFILYEKLYWNTRAILHLQQKQKGLSEWLASDKWHG